MNAPVNLPSTELAPSRRDAVVVFDTIPVLDSARFEHMQRIASIMARSSLIPECLCVVSVRIKAEDGAIETVQERMPHEAVLANCFLVVNQSVRWGMDPFAVVQCVSIVKGKLCYEGKLVAAVLDAKLGIELDYAWNDKKGDDFGIVVSGTLPSGKVKTADGTVGQWKTTGPSSPWSKQPKLQLAYRGAREWARLNKPAIMLGVYTEDEMSEMADGARERREADRARPAPPRPPMPAEVAQIAHQPQASVAAAPVREAVAAEVGRPTPPRPPAPKPAVATEAKTDTPPMETPFVDKSAAIADFETQLAAATSAAIVEEIRESFADHFDGMSRQENHHCQNLYDDALARVAT